MINLKTTSLLLLLLSIFLLVQSTISVPCDPGVNCKLPDCRCWDDKTNPGSLAADETPQMVLVSFGYAVNGANEELYASLFDDIINPNGCPTKGTFFVQNLNSNFDVIRALYDERHEIGVTSADGTLPSSGDGWVNSFNDVKIQLETSGIPADAIVGSRAPELYIGGDSQIGALEQVQLSYDSSCVTQKYLTSSSMLWPFTYDFIDTQPKCSIGSVPEKEHKGKWQFIVADLKVKDQLCASPSACAPFINSTQQAFDMLFNSFADHYEGQRTPFILYIDPLWLTVDYQKQGTKQFLQFIRAGFDDVFIVTNQQALAWIREPTPLSDIDNFDPWKCPNN